MKISAAVNVISVLLASATSGFAFSQSVDSAPKSVSKASGLVANGGSTAELTTVAKSGDRVTVKVRFVESDPDVNGIYMLYGNLDQKAYENDFYLLAGNKKYLLFKDSAGKPLAPEMVHLAARGKVRGVWYGTFPAPPENEDIMLFLPNVEPIGPFSLSDN